MRSIATWKPASIIASIAAAAGIVVGATGVWLLPDSKAHSDPIAVQEKTAISDPRTWVIPVALMPVGVDSVDPGDSYATAGFYGDRCRNLLAQDGGGDRVLSEQELRVDLDAALSAAEFGALVPVLTWTEGVQPVCSIMNAGDVRSTYVRLVRDPELVVEAFNKLWPENSRVSTR
ncbi:hypothetical protein SIM91_03005 [Rhodococcus opacus]|uniref:hypothetical protein n=1 Tax=Rhodococcus opacus TaxID=37919 RepID=UPI0007CD9A29|nr:hypothetical protein [Rhodococcus opacus]MDX5962312.1 hypothetical protein [Rhodococcus opacus]NKY76752.1 hypothetical protein [Rhodococcus opacus]CAG7642785.1 hypothetical protein E143388_08437 [Rhodococcus opacus]